MDFLVQNQEAKYSMSHQKNIPWIYDINGMIIIWLHKGLSI